MRKGVAFITQYLQEKCEENNVFIAGASSPSGAMHRRHDVTSELYHKEFSMHHKLLAINDLSPADWKERFSLGFQKPYSR